MELLEYQTFAEPRVHDATLNPLLSETVRRLPSNDSNSIEWHGQSKTVVIFETPNLGIYSLTHGQRHAREHEHVETQVTLAPTRSVLQARWHTATGKTKDKSIAPNEICVTSPMEPHGLQYDEAAESIIMCLNPSFISKALDGSTHSRAELIPTYGVQDRLIQSVTVSLLQHFRRLGSTPTLLGEAAGVVLVNHLWNKYASQPGSRARVPGGLSEPQLKRVREYIHEHLADELSLISLAEIAHASPFHFARMFKASMNIAPHQYVLDQRIREGKVLLRETSLSIAEIAFTIGFPNHSHFTGVFGRFVGESPRQYRQRASHTNTA